MAYLPHHSGTNVLEYCKGDVDAKGDSSFPPYPITPRPLQIMLHTEVNSVCDFWHTTRTARVKLPICQREPLTCSPLRAALSSALPCPPLRAALSSALTSAPCLPVLRSALPSSTLRSPLLRSTLTCPPLRTYLSSAPHSSVLRPTLTCPPLLPPLHAPLCSIADYSRLLVRNVPFCEG